MCSFQKLAFSEHGYVVRCNDCRHYQLGFGTAMLTLSKTDFKLFMQLVEEKIVSVTEDDLPANAETKSVVIPTPFPGSCIAVTKTELQHLHTMLEHADSEVKTLSLLELFK